MLRADRRFKCSHVYHVAAGAGDLFDLRSRFETGEVGKRQDNATASDVSLAADGYEGRCRA